MGGAVPSEGGEIAGGHEKSPLISVGQLERGIWRTRQLIRRMALFGEYRGPKVLLLILIE